MKDWLNKSGAFKFGKHKGQLAEDVAKSDPGYLEWIVNECEDVSDEDREILHQLLTQLGR